MNWKDIASAGKSIGKLDSLNVNESTKDTMKQLCVRWQHQVECKKWV